MRPPASDLARIAARNGARDVQLQIRETDGKNDSPRIRQYGKTVGIKPPSPYCAAAVCTWIKEGWIYQLQNGFLESKLKFRFSASSMGLLERNPDLVIPVNELTPEDIPCVFVIVFDEKKRKGHTGLVVGCDFETGKFQTIEANSNGAGARDGQGVYALDIRKLTDPQLKGFIRIA